MRAFVALTITEALRDYCMDLVEGLGIGVEIPEENLHLTLAFLGDQPRLVLEQVSAACAGLNLPLVRIELRSLAVLGGRSPSALVVLGEPGPELTALQAKVAQCARAAGVDLPRRRFKPHVTLARFGARMRGEDQRRLQHFMANSPVVSAGCEAVEFALYRSTLRRDGARYDVLARYPLGV